MDFYDYEDDDDVEEFSFTRVSEERRRFWAERNCADPAGHDAFLSRSMLFSDRGAELELRKEIRLSELWGRCQSGFFTVEEFRELSTLITEVDGIRGSLCTDCAMLDRPNVSANWALASTMLCRGHLRFRLAHAQIDDGGTYRPA
jgi:hypothetical protein